MSEAPSKLEYRILLRAATSRDAMMASAVLQRAQFDPHVCADMADLLREMSAGAGAVMLAEEVIAGPVMAELKVALASQGPWSDLPVIVLARRGADSRAIVDVMDEFANVTVIERPMRVAALVSARRYARRLRGCAKKISPV